MQVRHDPRGSSPAGAEIAPQPCIRLIHVDRNHDAVMRIGGEAPGQRAQSAQRLSSHGFNVGVTATSDSSADLARAAKLLVLLFHTIAHDAGRKMTPCGTSPLVARRQSAISSLRASATIIVLRVLVRLSVVRAANHRARALFFWNLRKRQANWIMLHRTRALPARASPRSRRRFPLSSGDPVRPA